MKQANAVIVATALVAGVAQAQPAPADTADPAGDGASEDAPGEAAAAVTPPAAPAPGSSGPGEPFDPYARVAPASSMIPALPKVVRPPVRFPEVLTTPTGWLLPAAVLYSKTGLDTGGGVTSDHRVGLGDVAEFGVATTDEVRERDTLDDAPARIQPYVMASFRLGVAEDRLFAHQPGVTLGFRKSFERNHRGFKTRIAELTLVASKRLGSRIAVHAGAAVWDASLRSNRVPAQGEPPPPEITLHGGDPGDQIRAFGGIEVEPIERSRILVDLGWAPEFCYACDEADAIRLRPQLSWGVRYEVARFLHLESGVRVPDIGNVNLLDAQIFGEITFTSYALADIVARLR